MASSVVDALIVSREKSVARCEAQVNALMKEAEVAPPAAAVTLRAAAEVKRQRLERLRFELASLRPAEAPKKAR